MRSHTIEYPQKWTLKSFSYRKDNNKVIVSIKGNNPKLSVIDFDITIKPSGQISIEYQVKRIPPDYIRELGIRFDLDNTVDSLSWQRDAYWSYYPPNHLSAPKGNVSLYTDIQNVYRKEPKKDWAFDTKSFYYNGTDNENINKELTYIAKATKENIRVYNLYSNKQEVLSVIGKGEVNCRIARKKNSLSLFAINKLDYFNLGWGNHQRNIMLDNNYSNKVVIQINTLSKKVD